MKQGKSHLLKFAIFATGLSGIVAEYSLATLASYFLHDTVVQWTLIVSVMLFSMGIGSQFSKFFTKNLLDNFIAIEFVLSFLSAYSAMICYIAGGFSNFHGFFIYGLAIIIGVLIGMEIPLVTRINEDYQELKENISSVLTVDYLGSLIGGVFFAFWGLPKLGMSYTPVLLGGVNFIVAIILLIRLRGALNPSNRIKLFVGALITAVVLVLGAVFAKPIILYGEQLTYKGIVVFEKQSRFQKIVITEWRDHHYLFINRNLQLSTFDEHLYHEPLVHPIMQLSNHPKRVLILGGGDGCALREVLKYPSVEHVDMVDLDSCMTNIGLYQPIFRWQNQGAMHNDKLEIHNIDAFHFLEASHEKFDAIIVDLPDPKTVDLNKLYSKKFYLLCNRALSDHGMMITQAGSPQFATRAFLCVDKTMKSSGFNTLKLHNSVITLGEWGWVLGAKGYTEAGLYSGVLDLDYQDVETQFITKEANQLLTSFGKPQCDTTNIVVNTNAHPVLYTEYLKGNWGMY